MSNDKLMFNLEFIIITIPILLVSITIHEFSHAKVADMLGDPTPRLAGRLTLNPIAHMDPLGFLMLIIVRFGWAKPVPINPYNFRDQKTGTLYVSLAGPLSNFIFAWILATVFKTIPIANDSILISILSYAIWINLALAIFNLIPIPPLDGSNILQAILPFQYQETFYRLQQYSLFLLLAFIMFGMPLLMAAVQFVYNLLV